jgi:thiamine biosynthesis lipoprotein
VLVAEDSATPPESDGEVIAIEAGAIATSSTTARTWRRGETGFHHLIDPATGDSVNSPWRTVSVAARDCVDANTAATAAIVRGASGLDWLDRLGLPARLVAASGDIHRVGQWPGWALAA